MKDVTTSDIQRLKAVMLKYEQAELKTEHFFANGVYLRMLYVPATCMIVGKIHKSEHLFVLAQGKMTIARDGLRKTFEAPAVIVSQPGVQRAGYAHEDCVCMNIHRTDKIDLEEVEAELLEYDPESPYLPGNVLKRNLIP